MIVEGDMSSEERRLPVFYCVACGFAQVMIEGAHPIPCPNKNAHDHRCGCKQFRQAPPEPPEREPFEWTANDRRFLRSLRIAADDDVRASVRRR